MKRLLILFILAIVISNSSVAQNSSDEKALKELIQNSFDDVLSNIKMETIPNYFTENFILLEDGEVWDMDKLKSMLASGSMEGMNRSNEFEFIQTKVTGETAWITYYNHAIFERDGNVVGEMNWLESATAIKTDKGWRMDMLHSTRIPSKE